MGSQSLYNLFTLLALVFVTNSLFAEGDFSETKRTALSRIPETRIKDAASAALNFLDERDALSASEQEFASAIGAATGRKVTKSERKVLDDPYHHYAVSQLTLAGTPEMKIKLVTVQNTEGVLLRNSIYIDETPVKFDTADERRFGIEIDANKKIISENVFHFSRGRLQKREVWNDRNEVTRYLPYEKPRAYGDIFGDGVPRQTTPSDVVVAIVDSGIDYNHPALAEKIPRPTLPPDSEGLRSWVDERRNLKEWESRVDLNDLTTTAIGFAAAGVATFGMTTIKKLDCMSGWAKMATLAVAAATPFGVREGAKFIVNRELEKNDRAFDNFADRIIGWDVQRQDDLPYDFTDDETPNPGQSKKYHGTAVADVASRGTNGIRLLPIRVIGDRIRGPTDYRQAIDFARRRGARIVNLSINLKQNPNFLEEVRKNPDMLFVVSAGNESANIDKLTVLKPLPGWLKEPNILRVAAIDDTGKLADFSNYGSDIQIAAHGVDVAAAAPGNRIVPISGTSFSAPQVTRVAARIKQVNPDLSVTEIMDVITSTARMTPELRGKVGFGQLDEAAAVQRARELRR